MEVNDQKLNEILKDCANLFYEKNSGKNKGSSPQSIDIIEQRLETENKLKTKQIGRYTIEAEIGEGGTGKVLKAYDTTLERTVALKMLSPEIAAQAEIIKRFEKEAKYNARLQHPRIVSLYDFFNIDNKYFLVMQFIEGYSLQKRMEQKLPLAKICKWMIQILDAIEYSHRNKIIHRDMKPSNILVDKEDNIFITDFGIAKLLDEKNDKSTTVGIILGTPVYMSPEQAQGMSGNLLDGRTDIYSIGVIFYEMLTGRHPFKEDNVYNILCKIVNEEIPSPKSLNPSIPDELKQICMKALQKDRETRYSTAQEMSSDIRAYLNYSWSELPTKEICLKDITQKKYSTRFFLAMSLIILFVLTALSFLFFKVLRKPKSIEAFDLDIVKKHDNIKKKALDSAIREKYDNVKYIGVSFAQEDNEDRHPPLREDERRNQALTAEQKAKVKKILAKYNAATLTAKDTRAIHEEFSKAGLRGGPAMREIVEEAGFDFDKLRDLAPDPRRHQDRQDEEWQQPLHEMRDDKEKQQLPREMRDNKEKTFDPATEKKYDNVKKEDKKIPVITQQTMLQGNKQDNRQRDGKKGKHEQDKQKGKGVERCLPSSLANKEYVYGKIILGRPTDKTITLSVLMDQDLEGHFEYGTKSGNYTDKTNTIKFEAGKPTEVFLSKLNPSTKYFYRILYRKSETSDFSKSGEYSFQTQRKSDEAFTFIVQADSHGRDPNVNFELYEQTLQNEILDKPDFLIDLGDTFMGDKFANDYTAVLKLYAEQRPYLGLVCHSAPLYLVSGNHEGETCWLLDDTKDNLAIWALKARKIYYPNPMPDNFYTGDKKFTGLTGNYYAWKWGDALFVVLDPYGSTVQKPKRNKDDNWKWTLGKNQYQWFKNTLEGSHEKFKFVFSHQLVGGMDSTGRGGAECAGYYEWGGKNKDGSWGFDEKRQGWGKPIHRLMVENRVTVFFHGHDHLFAKQDLDSIVYQEVPQPSHPVRGKTDSAIEYGYVNGVILSSSGHLKVTVSENKVTVDYVKSYIPKDERWDNRNREIAHSYTVTTK